MKNSTLVGSPGKENEEQMTPTNKVIVIVLLSLALFGSAFAKDHSNDYQMGTFISATAVADGTITSTLHGDGTTVAGDVYANHVGVYRIKVADGTWFVTTLNQAQDSMLRGMGMTPAHFKSEKANPLDGLKNGDKVLFRLHERHYLNGKFTLMAIPYADNPNKEVEFSTRFESDIAPSQPEKPTDNVKAMCDAHKLSPELMKQLCVAPTPSTSTEAPTVDCNAAFTGTYRRARNVPRSQDRGRSNQRTNQSINCGYGKGRFARRGYHCSNSELENALRCFHRRYCETDAGCARNFDGCHQSYGSFVDETEVADALKSDTNAE